MARQIVAHLRREVGIDADDVLFILVAMLLRNQGAPVAARRGIAVIAQNVFHQRVFKVRRAPEIPARLGQGRGEAIAGQRDQHDIKAVLGLAAMCLGVGQGADDLAQIPERPRPAVVDQKRHRVLALALHVEEVKRHAHKIDLELREFVHPAFDVAPVIVVDPILDQLAVIGGVVAVFPFVVGEIGRKAGALQPVHHVR